MIKTKKELIEKIFPYTILDNQKYSYEGRLLRDSINRNNFKFFAQFFEKYENTSSEQILEMLRKYKTLKNKLPKHVTEDNEPLLWFLAYKMEEKKSIYIKNKKSIVK